MAWIGADRVAVHGLRATWCRPLVVAGDRGLDGHPGHAELGHGAVPATEAGKASGIYSTLRELGGVFGIALLVAVFTGAGGYASPQAFTTGSRPRSA